MTNNERRIRLTCGLEILQKVHSDMCNDSNISRNSEESKIIEDLTYLITDLIKIIYEMNVDEM